ncbi:racemase [Nocardioides baekrokdamisoli]|uniref:Racemase n=1 Tax=Nocardioides baekrokdamisoli TaxID=1804624 RepID=A0A3G9IDL7_9ACTN|nr:amino acid racemase [Nocardioides baekrokdamisoli]BBH17047.1 racemase [Nocardioides baekrokdamisoli]
MKTIGLIGGMSWESSAAYYEGLNKGIQARLGGLHSAKIVMNSVDLGELNDLQEQGDWDRIGAILSEAAQSVERAGADFILLCTLSFHHVFDAVAASVNVPLIGIAGAIEDACKAAGYSTVGLLGTKFTLENNFFAELLSDRGLDVNLPDEIHVDSLDRIIYEELVFRTVKPGSRKRVLTIIDEIWDSGVDAILLGATELSLLVRPDDVDVPVIDVISVHVEAALDRALA